MEITHTTESPCALPHVDAIASGVFEDDPAPTESQDRGLGLLRATGEARADFAHIAVTHHGGRRLVFVGLGKREQFDAERAQVAAARVLARVVETRSRSLCWDAAGLSDREVAGLVTGTVLAEYRFDRYRSGDPHRLDRLTIRSEREIADTVERAAVLARAQNRARDLGNTPGNDLTPTALADHARALAAELPNLTTTVVDEPEIQSMGMGAFAAVAKGSSEDAKLIRIDYDGAGGGLLALVGKAVTFDAGGLSAKKALKMSNMKFDMGGGAAVIEAIRALAELQIPARVVGIVGATENMLSGVSFRPGDIVTALDGTTIEISNTDAEGRLILSDLISYARTFDPRWIVDVATLTSGVIASLGSVYTGFMSNDSALARAVIAAGAAAREPVWRLPLDDAYAHVIAGAYADFVNYDEDGAAGAITAAELLHHFARETPWAHLDIAGTGWDVDRAYFRDQGATGVAVRTLAELASALPIAPPV